MTESAFAVYQDGQRVARVDGPREQAESEIMHYAAMYAREGLPIMVKELRGKRWVEIAGWVGR